MTDITSPTGTTTAFRLGRRIGRACSMPSVRLRYGAGVTFLAFLAFLACVCGFGGETAAALTRPAVRGLVFLSFVVAVTGLIALFLHGGPAIDRVKAIVGRAATITFWVLLWAVVGVVALVLVVALLLFAPVLGLLQIAALVYLLYLVSAWWHEAQARAVVKELRKPRT